MARQEVDVGLLIQSLIGVRSVVRLVSDWGKAVEVLYVPVQDVAVGSVMQFLRGDISVSKVVTSVIIDEHVDPSHLAARTFGNADDAGYAVVQADAVGSVMQLFKTVRSAVVLLQVDLSHLAAKTAGRDPAVLYSVVP